MYLTLVASILNEKVESVVSNFFVLKASLSNRLFQISQFSPPIRLCHPSSDTLHKLNDCYNRLYYSRIFSHIGIQSQINRVFVRRFYKY